MCFRALVGSCAAAAQLAALSVQLPDAARCRRAMHAGVLTGAAVIVLDQGGWTPYT